MDYHNFLDLDYHFALQLFSTYQGFSSWVSNYKKAILFFISFHNYILLEVGLILIIYSNSFQNLHPKIKKILLNDSFLMNILSF